MNRMAGKVLRTNISTINSYTTATAKPTWHLKMNHPERKKNTLATRTAFRGYGDFVVGFMV